MIRVFILFAMVFCVLFGLLWLAAFTKYFDRARVRRIAKVFALAMVTCALTFGVVVFLFGLEHTIF